MIPPLDTVSHSVDLRLVALSQGSIVPIA